MDSGLYETFSREAWEALRDATPLTLGASDLDELRGLNERLDLAEVQAIYLPLSRLLNLHVAAAQARRRVTATFVGSDRAAPPYVIGLAGSVAVGKSTTARVLRALLARWPDHPRVDLVTTDGFLYPNAELEARDLLVRKGFPESYDVRHLLRFLSDVRSGIPASAPVYSHVTYDVLDGPGTLVEHPDILIIEGLNVLQVGGGATSVSDYFDFSIYVDAAVDDVRRWYIERFLALRETAFREPDSYFRHFAELSESQAKAVALDIWQSINERNLTDNILPTRDRASLVLMKAPDHRVQEIRLRRL